MKIISLLYKKNNLNNIKNVAINHFSTIELINNTIIRYNPMVECESPPRTQNKKNDEKIILSSNENIDKKQEEIKTKSKKQYVIENE